MKAKLVKEALSDVLSGPNSWDVIKDKLEWELEEYGIHEMEVDHEEPHTLYVSKESDITPLNDPAALAFGKSAYEGEGWFVVFEYPEPWPGAPVYGLNKNNMEESIKCECGNDKFWFFKTFVRCTNCFNEFKHTTNANNIIECWMRRFNHEEHKYNPNWEKWEKITQTEVLKVQ